MNQWDILNYCYYINNSYLFIGSHGASGKHESWEFDSGARDLSPEPNTLYKLIEAAGGTVSGCSNDLLELANKVSLCNH